MYSLRHHLTPEESLAKLLPYLVKTDVRWPPTGVSPVALSPVIYFRAKGARIRIVERVVDCAVLRVTDASSSPSCVPFIRVEWGEAATSAASPPISEWMPLWCFHPLAADSFSSTTVPIVGNHSAVMTWVIDTVARTCAQCVGGAADAPTTYYLLLREGSCHLPRQPVVTTFHIYKTWQLLTGLRMCDLPPDGTNALPAGG